MSRALRQLASWIALVAIVAVTFMPTLTHLVASAGDAAEVCSADAPRGTGQGDTGHQAMEHCPYCALHADLALPGEPRTAEAWVAAAFRELPQAFLRAPRASSVWSSAQSRAPPSFA